MSDPGRAIPEARPSATILLLRDGTRGLEVFMVQRHHRIDFATGALVFPGGKVEPADAEPALAGRCSGVEDLDPARRALLVAAIRETFEEAGVLLARARGAADLLGAERLRRIRADHRDALNRDETTLAAIAEAEDLTLACDLLVPFAHWVTPEFMPKRFDTHFFLVGAPAGQAALHDGSESVDSVWISPAAAVAEARARRRKIIFPTRMNLEKLARSRSVAEAVAAARRDPIVTVMPRVERTERGAVMRIPADAGYDFVEGPVDELH